MASRALLLLLVLSAALLVPATAESPIELIAAHKGAGRDLLQAGGCPDVPGYNVTQDQDQAGPVVGTVDGTWTSSNINTPVAPGAPGALAAACNANCNCTAFSTSSGNLLGFTNASTTASAGNCLYARTDVVACGAPRKALLDSYRYVIGVNGGSASCWTWSNSSATLTTSSCTRGANQVFTLQSFNASFPYYFIQVGSGNATQCVQAVVSGTTASPLALAPCTNATSQQFVVWTLATGSVIAPRTADQQALTTATQDGAAVIRPAWYNGPIPTSFLMNLQPEPDCAVINGFVPFVGVDAASPSYTLASPSSPVQGSAALAAIAATCNTDCRCNGLTSQGVTKTWVGAPSDSAPFGSCYYAKANITDCCPDLPGYNKTVGVAGNVNISIGAVPYTPGSVGTPLTPQILATAASTCNSSCLCGVFSVGVPLNSIIIRNRWQAFFYSSLQGDTTLTPGQSGDKCAYVKLTGTDCLTDADVFNATADSKRIRLSISSPFGVVCAQGSACPAVNCLASVKGNLGVLSGADCFTSPAAMFTAVGDGKGSVSLVVQDSGRCVDVPESAGVAIPFRACAAGQAGAGQRLKLVKPPGSNAYLLTIGNTCVYGTFPGPIASDRCLTRGDPLFFGQLYTVDTEPSCDPIPGFTARAYVRPTLTPYNTSTSTNATELAAACAADCKCQSFNSLGSFYNAPVLSTTPGGYGECLYEKDAVQDCSCAVIPGFRSVSGRTRTGSQLLVLKPQPSVQEAGQRCMADCKCKAFDTTGTLMTAIEPNAPSKLPTDCFYVKINQTINCTDICPTTNLQCLTSKFPAANVPPFAASIPPIKIPGIPGASGLLDKIKPATIIGLVQDVVLDKKKTGILEQVLTGALTLAEYTQNLQCPGAGLPIFSGQLIRSAGFLGPLSADSCKSLGVVDTNRYLVGAVSTSVKGWEDAVGTEGAGTISAALKILDSVSPQPKAKRIFAICLALDPCNFDFHLGFQGLYGSFNLPIQPPITVNLTFAGISYSQNGDGAGIPKSAIGLWTYQQPINADVPGSAIMGNLYMNVKADFTWGYVVAGKTIASLTLASDVKMVVRWVPPTRFALQIVVRPRINLFDNAYSIDFSKVESAISLSLLFYVEHYNEQRFNVYFGLRFQTKLQPLVNAVIPGKLGLVLSQMFSSDSGLDVQLNAHIDQSGGGVRLIMTGTLGLGPVLAKVLNVIAPNVPTKFSGDIGVMLRFMDIKGEKKVFGFALLNGKVYTHAFCGDDSDCLPDQVCFLTSCQKQVACLASLPRPGGALSSTGVCPSLFNIDRTLYNLDGRLDPRPGSEDCELVRCINRDGWQFKTLGDICERQCPWTRFFECLGLPIGYSRTYKKICPAGTTASKANLLLDGVCYTSCFNDAWQPGLAGKSDARARNRCYLTGNQALINAGRQLANGCPPGFPKKCSFVVPLGVGTVQEEYCVLDTVSCDNFKAVTTAVNKVCQV